MRPAARLELRGRNAVRACKCFGATSFFSARRADSAWKQLLNVVQLRGFAHSDKKIQKEANALGFALSSAGIAS